MSDPRHSNRCAYCFGPPLICTFKFDQWPEDYDQFIEEDCDELLEKPQEPDARSFCSHWCALEFYDEGRIFDDEEEDEGDDDEESEGCEECESYQDKLCFFHGSQFWYNQEGNGPSYYT
jgi:hypothetical protein